MKKTKKDILISKFLDRNENVNMFYTMHIDDSFSIREYFEQKNDFLNLFALRYEINTDINFREIIGAKELINNLSNSKIRKMRVIIYENKISFLQFYIDINATMIYGCLLGLNDKLLANRIEKNKLV